MNSAGNNVRQINPRMTMEWGGGVGGVDVTYLRFSEFFSIEDKTSAPEVFSSCSFIPGAHFETSLVMVSCYGCEI